MVNNIHIYVEGGGKHNNKYASGRVRKGFSAFIKRPFGNEGNRIRVVACGSREDTFRDFLRGLKANPDSFNILLVDSDIPVTGSALKYLRNEVGWNMREIEEDQCHLMVQVMEAWLLEAISKIVVRRFQHGTTRRTNRRTMVFD